MAALVGAKRALLLPRFFLDGRLDVAACYSWRRLRRAYRGALIRVRRSSDNAEQDFGAGQTAVSWAQVLAFIGGGSGFVSKWYDQSGLGRDLAQSTAAGQPQTSLLANGLAGMTFDGSNDLLQTAAFTLAQPWSFNLCYRRVTTVATRSFENIVDGLTADTGTLFNRVGDSPNGTDTLYAGSFGPENMSSQPTGTRATVGACFSGPASLLEVNGSSLESLTGNPSTGTPGGLTIGSRGDANAGRFTNMETQEWVVFNTAHSSAQLKADNAAMRAAWRF